MQVLAMCLLLIVAASSVSGQTITEITIDGLPAPLKAEDIVSTLGMKQGSIYNKASEPADRMVISSRLQDAGYLDADVKSNAKFLPAGIQLAYVITPHNLVTIDTVKVPGLSKQDIQGILDDLKITKDTPYNQDICVLLSAAIADKLHMNALFISIDKKLGSTKRDVTLTFLK